MYGLLPPPESVQVTELPVGSSEEGPDPRTHLALVLARLWRRGFRDFVRRNVRYGRAENLVFASDTLELLPGSGAFNPRIRAKAGVDRPAPDAEQGPVLAYASKAKKPDESARPMVPVGGGLGAALLRARAAA